MSNTKKHIKPFKLIKPRKSDSINKLRVQAYTTESGNPGCVECRSGCYNCGCRRSCAG